MTSINEQLDVNGDILAPIGKDLKKTEETCRKIGKIMKHIEGAIGPWNEKCEG